MNEPKGDVLYRRPLPAIPKHTTTEPTTFVTEKEFTDDEISPAPPVSRENKRRAPPPLLSTADTPYADEEIWQWLVANSEITSSLELTEPRSRTKTKDKRHHSDALPDELPPRGAAPFPGRQPRRQRNRNFAEFLDQDPSNSVPQKQNQFTLQDFLLKMENKISKPVLQKAVLSKHNFQKILKVLAERVEEDSKRHDSNKGLAVFDLNEEFDLQSFKREMKSPRPNLESALSVALTEHIQEVDMEQQQFGRYRKEQLDELELPASLAKMKADQYRRNAWKKQQKQAFESELLHVSGQTLGRKMEFDARNGRQKTFVTDDYPNPTDSLQFYAEPTHFQDSVRTREPFALVNREDEVSPTEFAVLESLFSGGRWLSLKAHFIGDIPNLMLLRKTLTYINLSFNCFTEIPGEMYEMENLQILKMRNNPIKEIPHDCIRLKRLRVLVLSFCMVSSISVSFWYGMEKLILLDLSFNQLTSVPNEVMYLKSLRELNLAGNQLIGLPSGALYLNLKLLNIAHNYMHPFLWRENTKNSPQRLQDLAAHKMVKDDLTKFYPDLPEPVKAYLGTGFTQCDACKGPRFGRGLLVIRPCEFIFGIRNLPFVFNCCSPECVYVFRRGIADPFELRDGDKDQDALLAEAIMPYEDPQQNAELIRLDSYSPFSPVRRNTNMSDYTRNDF